MNNSSLKIVAPIYFLPNKIWYKSIISLIKAASELIPRCLTSLLNPEQKLFVNFQSFNFCKKNNWDNHTVFGRRNFSIAICLIQMKLHCNFDATTWSHASRLRAQEAWAMQWSWNYRFKFIDMVKINYRGTNTDDALISQQSSLPLFFVLNRIRYKCIVFMLKEVPCKWITQQPKS